MPCSLSLSSSCCYFLHVSRRICMPCSLSTPSRSLLHYPPSPYLLHVVRPIESLSSSLPALSLRPVEPHPITSSIHPYRTPSRQAFIQPYRTPSHYVQFSFL
ncbi:hypothetical protein AMTRI_Chr10g225620 [Amborella trichopoda]